MATHSKRRQAEPKVDRLCRICGKPIAMTRSDSQTCSPKCRQALSRWVRLARRVLSDAPPREASPAESPAFLHSPKARIKTHYCINGGIVRLQYEWPEHIIALWMDREPQNGDISLNLVDALAIADMLTAAVSHLSAKQAA